MSKVIRWGILGAGRIARKFASDLKLVSDAQLVAIGSRSMDSAEEFAAVFRNEAGKPRQLAQDGAAPAVSDSSDPHPRG